MEKRMAFALIAMLISSLGVSAYAASPSDFTPGSFTLGGTTLPYQLYIPPTYNPADTETRYPLVLFLHGAGERGTDNLKQINGNINNLLARVKQTQYASLLVAPQANGWWSGAELVAAIALVENLRDNYNVDSTRLYITGLSMGGMGTWDAIATQPKLFAAAVPICGSGGRNVCYRMVDQNVWAFHAADDPTVSVSGSRNMIAGIIACGGDPLYTEYPTGGHGIWGTVYNTTAMYQWMYACRGQGIHMDSIPPPKGTRLEYTKTALGDGLFGYRFEVYNDDGYYYDTTLSVAFRGVNGAVIHQVLAFGVVSVDTETNADYFATIPSAGYTKATDSWLLDGYWNQTLGINPWDGSHFNGTLNGANLFAVAGYDNEPDGIGSKYPLAYVVADGDIEWSGTAQRFIHTFNPAGNTVTSIPGDYNGDGVVDLADYTVWADHYGQSGQGVAGDGNGDGTVDLADYTVWADHYGQSL
jgi:poly(3-hydroxybutyrate) depolymerase